MLDLFHSQFVPEAVKHEGYMRVKLLKRRTVLQGTAPASHNYRFELEFESEELRQRWIASPGHQRVWPPIERFIKTQGTYPVVLVRRNVAPPRRLSFAKTGAARLLNMVANATRQTVA